ncbi:DUF885 domain-containing protein [Sphingomonas lenta]|uniref:DUF885 domain-containing protein n=1 Tax=Sphingomonas lenta TaxID=1141887 RepID=A0A2A2SDY0_9SPHN|nr:DUF885 family protein [Sphingomonas lenta]PAX07415.1 DUF885 domain-containing protein [Sphingomonas lenta]
MDRRHFLYGTAASVGAALAPSHAFAQGTPDARLNALFGRIFDDTVDSNPEFATGLGLDKGARAKLKYQLDGNGLAERAEDLARTRRWLAEVERFPVAGLSPAQALNREIVLYSLRNGTVAPTRFELDSAIRPYRIFQQGGAYFSTPDFLNDTHTIETQTDAEAYLSRLGQFARVLDEDVQVQRADAARGYVAPAWSLDLTLGQMKKLRSQPAAESTMVRSLVTRAKAKNVAGDWGPRATRTVETVVYPALDRQIAFVQQLRGKTQEGDGVWRVPQGDAIYAVALAQATTTDFTPEQVHQMGLEQVASISAELDKILRAEGLTQGSVGQRLAQLNKRPDQLYADTPEGRAQLLASLNEGVRDMKGRLPRVFAEIPATPLEIRAVPVEIQDGASNGYYRRASLDGSRPAIYYINLKDTGDWPKYTLPALTYHEGDPGHHLQISTAQTSADIPTLRKIGFFGAYSEGWALYAEEVADELGAYKTPLERAGYLQSFLFRAARLVVDTGIHTKRWDRARATRYLVETTGFAEPRSQREVERYCTQPGQACSYKVGHMAWVRARQAAQKRLGDRFDIKRFHAVLKDGAMPLSIMERLVAERMA